MYFQAVKDKSKVMYVIQGERGGVVPKELQGKYTKKQFADDAIKAYSTKHEAKNEVQTGTSKRGGRSSGSTRKKELSGS